MKIAMISRYLPSEAKGGVGYQVHYLANTLIEKGHQVTVFSLCKKPNDAQYDVSTITLPRNLKGKILRTYAFAFLLRGFNFDSFDIIHSHGDEYLLRKSVTPVLRTFHGSAILEAVNSKSLGGFLRQLSLYPLEFLCGLKSNINIAVSKNTTKCLPFIKNVIPCGVNINEFLKEENKTDFPTILFVGTIKGRKRGELLIDHFKKNIKNELPNAQLWLVADQEVNVDGVINFGRVSTQKLIELYNKAWVFCLPSSYEGFGVPYIEALASKCAVVATKNPGSIEILNGTKKVGVISKDIDLGHNIKNLLIDSATRETLTEEGLEEVKKYNWDTVSDSYIRYYNKLIEA